MSDDYTCTPTRVRIVREEQGDEWPWILDGIDRRTGDYTEGVLRFSSREDCLAAMPRFVADVVEEGATWEWGARIYALTDPSGTAMPETARCHRHRGGAELVEASGNAELSCQVCGATS